MHDGVCVVSTMYMVPFLKMISYTQNQQICPTNLNTSVVIRAKNKQEDIDPKVACLLLQRIAYPNLTHL